MLCSSVGQRPAAALGVPRDWLLFSLSSCSVSVAGRPNAAAPTTAQTAAPIADARAMVAGAAGAGLAVTFRSAIFAIVVVAGAARSTPTAVASAKNCRRSVCIEKNEDYFDIACKRVDEASRQVDLFIKPPKQSAPVQTDMLGDTA